jgi:hypothetical protein
VIVADDLRRLTVAVFQKALVAVASRSQTPKLMLCGGQGHKTYLGCLNCGNYAADSISNSYGVRTLANLWSARLALNWIAPPCSNVLNDKLHDVHERVCEL